MSKSYSEGYTLGQQDGAGCENRLPARAWMRLAHVGSYLPGAENRDDEWRKGYRQGFEDRVRQVNVVQRSGETAMGLNQSGGMGAAAAGGGTNTFAHRIAVARSLYEQALRLQRFVEQTGEDFGALFSRHDVLVGEFFNDLLTYHIRPRMQQLYDLAESVQTQDRPRIAALVEKYEIAISGKEALGQAAATRYFASINLSSANRLSGLTAALGDGDPRDYETQLAVAQSIRRAFEALLEQLDAMGRAYDACARDHDELMRQDFDALIRQNIEPRLQEISDLYRAVQHQDLPGVDDVISRLRTVSSM